MRENRLTTEISKEVVKGAVKTGHIKKKLTGQIGDVYKKDEEETNLCERGKGELSGNSQVVRIPNHAVVSSRDG